MTAPRPAGTLWLMPNTLDLGATDALPIEQVLPAAVVQRAASLRHWVAEDAKSTRAFLKRVHAVQPLVVPIAGQSIVDLPRAQKGPGAAPVPADFEALLAPAFEGHDLGLISEAGLPAVADPGAQLVAAAHRRGVPVVPLPGPSSLLLALAASGLNGQSFAFAGYLPTDTGARAARVRTLEATSRRERQTQLAIETPYRNAALAAALVEHLQPTTLLSIACGLTLPGGWCLTRPVRTWRSQPPHFADKHLPAVFAFLAGEGA